MGKEVLNHTPVFIFLFFVVFAFMSAVALIPLDILAPHLITDPCWDGPFNCEDFRHINSTAVNVALGIASAGIVGMFLWWVNLAEEE